MKIITTIIIFLHVVICENASAASAYSWLSGSHRSFGEIADYTSREIRGAPNTSEYSRFDPSWGELTGVTVFTEIAADFYVSKLLPTDSIDFTAPLTVIGFLSAGNPISEYNESFNISGNGYVKYSVNQIIIKLIPESDWSKFILFPNNPPMEIFSSRSHSTLYIDIISPNLNPRIFSGMTVSEDTKVKYDYNEPPLAAGVPEPASYALMLIGLGAMGFVARRRDHDAS